ncbi:MAG: hypothetical protein Q8P67_27410, partial [archaeon]|nr:hypothetical protein [archaeon]
MLTHALRHHFVSSFDPPLHFTPTFNHSINHQAFDAASISSTVARACAGVILRALHRVADQNEAPLSTKLLKEEKKMRSGLLKELGGLLRVVAHAMTGHRDEASWLLSRTVLCSGVTGHAGF